MFLNIWSLILIFEEKTLNFEISIILKVKMWKFEFWPNLKTKIESWNHGLNVLKFWKSLKLFGLSLNILWVFRGSLGSV